MHLASNDASGINICGAIKQNELFVDTDHFIFFTFFLFLQSFNAVKIPCRYHVWFKSRKMQENKPKKKGFKDDSNVYWKYIVSNFLIQLLF